MFLSLLVPGPLGTTAGFLAAGAAGIVMSRRMQHADTVVPHDPAVAKRIRTGRLPLPRRVTALTPSDQRTLALVNVFVDRLADLSPAKWLDIGRLHITDGAMTPDRAEAFAVLQATIARNELGIAAWYVRDAVETSACLAANCVHRWTRADRRAFAAAHGAAEDAALALLACDCLAADDFEPLFAPFEQVLPNEELTRLRKTM